MNGALKTLTAPQLGIVALKHAFETSGVNPEAVEEIYLGNVVQAGVGQSPARQVALGAGMSVTSDATTINKVCASGMKAIMIAAQSISSGYKSVVAAGGMESMSNAPYVHIFNPELVLILMDQIVSSFLVRTHCTENSRLKTRSRAMVYLTSTINSRWVTVVK